MVEKKVKLNFVYIFGLSSNFRVDIVENALLEYYPAQIRLSSNRRADKDTWGFLLK